MIGTRLPDDWQPSEAEILYGIGLGFITSQVLDIAEDLRLWAAANGHRQIARKLNWSAAFKSWLRREAAKRGTRYGTANPIGAAFDKIADYSTGGHSQVDSGNADLGEASSGSGQETFGFVSPRKAG
jgi:hypothetical protein